MNITDALGTVSAYSLSDVEYIRLVRMGFHDSEIDGMTSLDYEAIVEAQKVANPEHVSRSGKLNIWRVAVTIKQIAYLGQFGYTFRESEKRTLSDARARDFICIVNHALGNRRFVESYPSWLASSTRTKKPKFSQVDVDRVSEQIVAHFQSLAGKP